MSVETRVFTTSAALLCGLGSLLASVPDSASLLQTFAWDNRAESQVGLASAFVDGKVVALEGDCQEAAGRTILLLCAGVVACVVSFATHFARAQLCDSVDRRQAAIFSAAVSSISFAASTLIYSASCSTDESAAGLGQYLALAAGISQMFATISHVRAPVAVRNALPVLSESLMGRKFAPVFAQRPARHGIRRHVEETGVAEPIPEPIPEPEPTYDPRNLPGAIAPLGYFDPLGLSEVPLGRTMDAEARTKYFREAELKHGRVAMLAALGFLVGEQFHPLFGGNIDVPSYVAFQQTPLQTFWPIVVAIIGAIEVNSIKKYKSPVEATWSLKEDAVPGEYGFDPLGLKPKVEKDLYNMQSKELSNGRLAMLAIAGMVGQELANGEKLFSSGAAGTDAVDPAKVAEIAKEMADVLNATQ